MAEYLWDLPIKIALRDYNCLRVVSANTVYYVAELKPGQIRCGEHSDYGSITLLYSDSPGLEVNRTQPQHTC